MSHKILLISSNSSDKGGGEHYLIYLTQGLRLLGCDVHVLLSTVSYMDNWANNLAKKEAYVHRLPLLGLRHRPLRFIQSIFDKKQQQLIAEFCQKLKPHYILVNQQYDEDGLDYVAGALMSNVAPVGGVIHMPMTADKNKRFLGKLRGILVALWYARHPYSLIFVSQGSKKEFEQYYRHPRATYVVNHGCPFINNEINSSNTSTPYSWDDTLPVVGFSGQFVAQKNLQLLVESWLWTRRQGFNSRLLLIGDGQQRRFIEKKLKNSVVEDAWYITGWQKNPMAYLSVLDVYLMTSNFEGLPLSLLEALDMGIPAVVTNFNGATDIAKYASWLKIATKMTPQSIGTNLIECINRLPQLKKQAIEGQKEFRSYFSLERMASETLKAINSNL